MMSRLWYLLACYRCYCSVSQLWPTLVTPMDCSMPGFPVLHYLPKSAQTRVHWVCDTIHSSLPLFSSVESVSCAWLFATPWIAARQASLSITNSQSLLEVMSIELVVPSNHLIVCHPLLLLPSIFPSIRVFSNESVLRLRWPKYWSFSFNISRSYEYSGLISFRIDWLDLLAVQGTLKSLLQHHSSKASILGRSAFSIVHNYIHDYWKNHSLV